MRILLLLPTLGTGGAERLSVACAHGLAERGHDVHVAYGFADSQLPNLTAVGIDATRLCDARLSSRTLPAWVRALRGVVRSFRPDVVYAQSITAALAARLAAPTTPLLVTVHGIREADEPLASLILRAGRARVTAVSDAVAEGLRRHRVAPRIEVLPPGVDVEGLLERSREPVELAPGRPRFVCVGRQSAEKGIDVLIAAFAYVRERLPDVSLTLVGVGPQQEANERLVAELGLAERVAFVGLLPNPAPSLAAADVVVLPSRREGLPVAALEALALGRPLVATEVGGTPEVVKDGETGWLVPPEDPAALAHALVEAASDEPEARRRAAAGARLVRERFTSERMVDRIETLALELVRPSSLTPRERSRTYYRTIRGVQAARIALASEREWQGVRIFGYHRVSDDDDVFAVGVADFRRHMQALAGSGVQVLRLDEALERLHRPVAGRFACVTFDDGYHDNLANAIPILAELGLPATIFVATGLLGDGRPFPWHRSAPRALSWDDVEQIVAQPLFDVQAHSRTHPRLTALPDALAWDEISGSKHDLEERLPYRATSFCYPAGLYGERETALVRRAGYEAAVTTRSGVNAGGTSAFELRRTMLYWRDGVAEFEAKLHGRLDRPLRLQELAQRVRARG